MLKRFQATLLISALILSSFFIYTTPTQADSVQAVEKKIWDAKLYSPGTIAILYESQGKMYVGWFKSENNDWEHLELGSGSIGALDVGSDGSVHIAYVNQVYDLVYTRITQGKSISSKTFDSNNIDKNGNSVTIGQIKTPDISVDSNGNVHMVYIDTYGGQSISSYYGSQDLIYLSNSSGSWQQDVKLYGQGEYAYGDGWKQYPSGEPKIGMTSHGYYIQSKRIDSYKSSLSGWDDSYSHMVWTPDSPSVTTSCKRSYDLKDIEDFNGSVASLSYSGSSYELYQNGLGPIELSIPTNISAIDLDYNNQAYIAGLDSTTLYMYQSNNIKSIPLPEPLNSSHKKVATVEDGGIQYVIYTTASGNMIINLNNDLDSSDIDLFTFTVPDKKEVILSGLSISDKEYNGNPIEVDGTIVAYDNQGNPVSPSGYDGVFKNSKGEILATPPKDVGNYTFEYSILESDSNYYGKEYISFSITKKTVSISDITATDRDYNGSTSVSLSGGTINDKIPGDDLSLSLPTTGQIQSPSVGQDKSVSIGNVSLSGSDADNYSISQVDSITVTIMPKALSILTGSVADKTYDGTMDANIHSVTFIGLADGEDPQIDVDYSANGSFEQKETGSNLKVLGSVSLYNTPLMSNYHLDETSFSSTGNIVKSDDLSSTSTITLNMTKDMIQDYTFDMDQIQLSKTDTGSRTYMNVSLVGDDIFETPPTIRDNRYLDYTSASVTNGSSIFTVQIITDNYSPIDVPIKFELIDKEPLQLSGLNLVEKNYDGLALEPSGTIIASNLAGENIPGLTFDYLWKDESDKVLDSPPKNVGNYTLTVTISSSNSQYQGRLELKGKISPKPLEVIDLLAETKVYDGLTTMNIVGGNLNGIVDGESVDLFVPSTGTAASSSAGSNIDVSVDLGLEGADISNYSLATPYIIKGTIAQRPLTITNILIGEKVYDQSLDGLINDYTLDNILEGENLVEDTDFTLSGSFVTADAGIDKAFMVTGQLLNTSIANNYTFADNDFSAHATIHKAPGQEVTFDQPLKLYKNRQRNYNYNLELATIKFIDYGDLTFSFDRLDGDDIFSATPSVTENQLNLSVKSVGDSDISLYFTVETSNYETIEASLDIEMVNPPRNDSPVVAPTVTPNDLPEEDTPEEDIPEENIPEILPTGFIDISTHWARKSIESLLGNGLLRGYSDGTYKPDNYVTRSEFLVMVLRSLNEGQEASNTPFLDVQNHWAKNEIETAFSLGIIKGYSDTKFKPNQLLTRQEMAKMITIAYHLTILDSKPVFIDDSKISPWAQNYVYTLYKAHVLEGYVDGSFKPNQPLTRAEAAEIIDKALRYIINH